MGTLLQDLRYGLRMLAKNPGFTAVAVLTLALGIGPTTAIFSVMNAVVVRYLPVANPQQLVYLNETGWPSGAFQTGSGGLSFPEHTFAELRTQHSVFSDLMAFVPLGFDKVAVRYGDEPEEARAEMVSGNFFSGLEVRSARGRTLIPEDERQHAQVAVLSYAYWTRRFSRNPSVIGQTLYVKGVPFTIVGVASQDFWGVEPGKPTDVWIPLQSRPDVTAWGISTQDGTSLYGSPNWWCLMMIGRLQPGISRQRALALLTPLFQRSAYEGLDCIRSSAPPRPSRLGCGSRPRLGGKEPRC